MGSGLSNSLKEAPQDVINEWLKQCECCPSCNQDIPCDGVMAGGMCDQACQCEDESEQDYELPWDEQE